MSDKLYVITIYCGVPGCSIGEYLDPFGPVSLEILQKWLTDNDLKPNEILGKNVWRRSKSGILHLPEGKPLKFDVISVTVNPILAFDPEKIGIEK